jgi:hypothetical protein
MSETNPQGTVETKPIQEKKAPPAKKVFSRSDVKLSREAEERRQEYLSLSAADMTVKLREQALDEICDLLVALPKGFSDLQDTGQGPGHSYRSYVETADPETKDILLTITEGADNLYWSSISPREFPRTV